MALEFLFNKTNFDLEDAAPLGGPINGVPGLHPNTPRNTYTDGSSAVTKENSRLQVELSESPVVSSPDPTQYPSTTLGSTNISGHFPTSGKSPELFTQKYTPENTYLDQINSQ